MTILFINGGEKGGNTSALGRELVKGRDFDQIDLVEYKVYDYGQSFDDDQFDEVLARFKQADTIVLGSPVYWHDLSGMVRKTDIEVLLLHSDYFGKIANNPLFLQAGKEKSQNP